MDPTLCYWVIMLSYVIKIRFSGFVLFLVFLQLCYKKPAKVYPASKGFSSGRYAANVA